MAWIEVLERTAVLAGSDKLARLYKGIEERGGVPVDNVLQIHSLRPETLDGHLKLYRSVMFPAEGLSRREREAIAVAVSAFNRCHY